MPSYEEELAAERRIALLLADGTGDFDHVRACCFHDLLILRGYVRSMEARERAQEIAKGAGFTTVINDISIRPPER